MVYHWQKITTAELRPCKIVVKVILKSNIWAKFVVPKSRV